MFNIKKKVDRFLKNKTNNPLQVYETFDNSKPSNFIGDQCNEGGLNESILDIFLATGKKQCVLEKTGQIIPAYTFKFLTTLKKTHTKFINFSMLPKTLT